MLNSTLTLSEREDLLRTIIPGQNCSDTIFDPPKTRVYFSNVDKGDIEDFHRYSLDERLYEFFEFEPVKNRAESEDYYHKMLDRMKKGKSRYNWFVRIKENNRLIGTATLDHIDFQRNSVMWGQGIDPNFWGENYNLEVHEILKHFIFDVLKMNRLYGQTMVNNQRAIAGVKASGCIFEGIMRQYYKKGNKYIDAWSYSLLSTEYFNQNSSNKNKNLNISIEEIIELISNTLESDEISDQTTMSNCWLWDSLSHETIVSSITSRYNIKVSPLDYFQLTSVNKIHGYLTRK